MFDSDSERDAFEIVAAEFTDRCRLGESPSIDEYASRYPDLADDIRDLFPTIAAIEGAKSASPGRSGGGPVRGGLHLQRLGDFRIVRELGRGGMGVVYEAEQESLGRRVALKVLPPQSLLDPTQLSRFEQEARTAARLHHTNIVPVFGVGSDDGYHYFVMQYIRGVGLDAVLRELRRTLRRPQTGTGTTSSATGSARSGSVDALDIAQTLARDASSESAKTPTPIGLSDARETDREQEAGTTAPDVPEVGSAYWRGIAQIALQAAEALDYAHNQGTLHRDIKPSNLLVDADGTVWIADFGLAKMQDQGDMTLTSGVVGTLRYIAPEQLEGRADGRSDIYSLGLTLYEMATLRSAFSGTSRATLISDITRGTVPSPRSLCRNMPRDIETIMLKCIAREPALRYGSAGALATDLRRFLEDRPIMARRASRPERLWRWSRRNPALAMSSAIAAMLLVAVTVVSTAAYLHSNRANVRVRDALESEQAQREKAEANSSLAIEAIDTIFEQFAPSSLRASSSITIDGGEGGQVEVPIQPVLSEETAALLEHMLDFYRRLAAQEDANPAIRLKIAEANRRVGDIHNRLGNFEEAKTAYARAISLFERIEKEEGISPPTQVELARIQNEIGVILFSQERADEGRILQQSARTMLESLRSTVSFTPAVRYELARTCFLLARAPRPPIPSPRPGLWNMRESEEAPPLHSLARGRRRVGDPRMFRERAAAADAWQEAVDLLNGLIGEFPKVPDYRHLLALCYRETPPAGPRSPVEALPRAESVARAVEILRQLVADSPDVPEYRFDLSETLAMAAGPEGDGAIEQAQALEEALAISERLVAERPNIPRYAVSQVHIRMQLADHLRRSGRSQAAEAQLDKALSLQTGIARQSSDVPMHQVFAAMIEGAIGRLHRDAGRIEKARKHLEVALAILDGLPKDWDYPAYVNDVFIATHEDLARVLRQGGDLSAAREAEHGARQYDPDH